ncbi:ubiquinone-dependent pyruvate dehydrogenase [Gilliamella sp. B2776]|uniref:thiamine pyrophosphate-dependent enzyme n=1 Tax=unclassified Gilliamella TaxID=2685620 RepID=UPI002269CFE3|nr:MULTISPECIES: thiamine pyrophosphate-dependent enzyme [unclassified Gilliamella]MCX8649813.1 ubiquinone-dependent pyruvate dehydrogenase [Gilliamella sp. B2779]MCX8653676.1 ubiquinone-dependent pyruvate dehydrogenase [Gilliamella sp. B2737]MCX8656133.1 ubiquinone-dependent pyruvate dehydrogenase [Gilliamella sp. B2894]MCX8664559.1 ubiquinone-dependent pyruvate dehydrogenase [Gilliamella sp. B2887]MCX8691586.1 ubiquinone-dependent pyruvate dehydrogenase [Gilliamella sp. B2776]
MTSKKTVAQIIVDILGEAGVKHCYGIVGDTLNQITSAIEKSDIEWVHVRHEEVGAFAAGAEAYLTDQITACAGSCGPGSLHFINGIYEAQRNRVPVILLASQLITSQQGNDFPQEVDFESVYKNCSVFCREISDATQVREITTAAIQAAINRRGVAVLVIPYNISLEKVEDKSGHKIYHPKPIIRPSDKELAEIADIINKNQKVTIFAGQGVYDAHNELIAFAEKIKSPIVHTSRGKDFVEYDNPYNVGMTGMFGVKSGTMAIKECDVLIMLGTDFAWSQFYPNHAKIIQIDIDATHLGRRHPVSIGVVGSSKPTLTALLPLVNEKKDTKFLETCQALYSSAMSKLNKKALASKSTIHPQYLTELIDKYATDDAVLCADVGSAMVWACRHFNTNGKRRTVISLKHGTMANAMPQALGVQKAFPNRQVITLSGDGGISMLLGDLLTTIQEKLPIKIIVLNNSSLNFVELEQKVEGLINHYTDLQNPDFAKVAESMGLFSIRVDDSDLLEAAMQSFLTHDGPALLDVKTSADELVMPPEIHASQVMGMALYSMKASLSGKIGDVMNLLVDNFIKK